MNLPPVVTNGRVAVPRLKEGVFPAVERSYDPDGPRGDLRVQLVEPAQPGVSIDPSGKRILLAPSKDAANAVTQVFPCRQGGRVDGRCRRVRPRQPGADLHVDDREVDGNTLQTIDLAEFVSDPDGDGWDLDGAGVSGVANGTFVERKGKVLRFLPNSDTKHAQLIANVIDDRGKTKARRAALTFDFKVFTNLLRPPSPCHSACRAAATAPRATPRAGSSRCSRTTRTTRTWASTSCPMAARSSVRSRLRSAARSACSSARPTRLTGG